MGVMIDGGGTVIVYFGAVPENAIYRVRFRQGRDAWTYRGPLKKPTIRLDLTDMAMLRIQVRAERGARRSEWAGVMVCGYDEQ